MQTRTTRFARSRQLVSLLAVTFVTATAATAQMPAPGNPDRALTVEKATEVVRQWRPGQHLYVKGDLGASAAALDGLEVWLDQNATNWVVVLAQNADGETYADAEGHTFQGVEAANHALGKGLINQTSFGQQIDPRTGERNAAFFMLFLKERRLCYYGSDAQDKRGLGEDRWIGNLDKPAVSAMRNGARVIDAAQDTISNINGRLAERITAEAKARAQRQVAEQRAREQAAQEAAAAVERARQDFVLFESQSGEFSRRFAQATGDLGRPDLAGVKSELAAVQAAAEQGDAKNAQRLAEALHARVQTLMRALAQYPEDGRKLEDLSRRLDGESARPFAPAAKDAVQSARESLQAAAREYQRGDSSYPALLDAADRAIGVAGVAISNAEVMAARQRTVMLMGAFALLTGAAVIALLLNRRRKPAMVEARHLYELWANALSDKTTALFALLDRRMGLVGESEDEAIRRYSGGTLQLGRQIIQDVDELFIMSCCAGRVLQEAGSLINPPVVWSRLANLFVGGRYREAIALLRDQAIAFKPEEGLELVVRGSRTERDRLVGELQSYQPFTMTFNELISAFNERAQRALAGLDQLESSLLTAPDKLKSVQESIEQTKAELEKVAGSAREDGWFELQLAGSQLLPSAQRRLAKARETAVLDPINALRLEGARAEQEARDAAALVGIARNARENVLPKLRAATETLAQNGIATKWIIDAIGQCSLHADQAGRRASESSAEAEISAIEQAVANLLKTSSEAGVLSEEVREECTAQISQATSEIKRAREEIGAGLGVADGEVLREEGEDPTEFVAQAQAQLEAARAALSRGDLAGGRTAVAAVADLCAQANQIVKATREAFGTHESTLAELKQEADRIAASIPEHARILAEINNSYAPPVLALGAGDPTHPKANGTIADNIRETEENLSTAHALIMQSAEAFTAAKLLDSAMRLRAAREQLEIAAHRLAEVRDKQQRLTEAEQANRKLLQALETRMAECERLTNEPATMSPTIRAFEEAARSMQDARALVATVPGNPFASADLLSEVQRGFDTVADMARCDRDVHEQAGRSLASAATQLAAAEQIAARSASDNLPDSPAILQARGVIGSLGASLGSVREKHGQSHGDWHALDEEATGIANRAAAAAATLKGELEQAEASVAALSAASDRVRTAGSWTGGYGVIILGTPGADVLTQARTHLERGDYDLALRTAENARRAADRAIAQAQAEVQRRQIEEEERIEAERRRRRQQEEQRRRAASSFSSNFGAGSSPGGSSSSWGSSSSGTRSSSFSSGSGVSTSSW